jgi:hypothetical protein
VRAPRITAALLLGTGALAMAVPAASAGATIAFAPAEQFPTGSAIGPGPGAVTTIAIDVDGDTDVDVVTTDWFGDGPLVLRNTGTGSFGAAVPITGAADVGALAAGDVTGDGRPDLVGRENNGVVVLTGNGDGTFTVGARVAVSSNAQQSVAVIDTNGDHRLDIATPAQLGVQLLLGHGDGTFSVGTVTPLMGLLADIKAANLDGDGIADLLVADATPLTQRIVAFRGNGDGTFVQSGEGVVGYGPEAVMAGDLNGDGRDDAVSVDSFSAFNTPPSFSITVLLGDGHGGFRPPAAYPTGDGPVSGALADFNADGRLDVAVSAVGSSVVTVYAGDGAGGLVEAGRLTVVRQPQTPVAADFNRDGGIDIAVPGVGQLSVLRNASAAPPSAASTVPGQPRAAPSVGALAASGPLPPLWVGAMALGLSLVLRRRRSAVQPRGQ